MTIIFNSIDGMQASPVPRTAGKRERRFQTIASPQEESCQGADFHRKLFEIVAKNLTVSGFLLILPCLSGKVFPEWGGSKWFGVVELEGKYLRSRNKVRRNGTEERPEWGASPAKPSKPLRTEAKRIVLPLGVRTEFLAGGISG